MPTVRLGIPFEMGVHCREGTKNLVWVFLCSTSIVVCTKPWCFMFKALVKVPLHLCTDVACFFICAA